jgi:hypothetical protein
MNTVGLSDEREALLRKIVKEAVRTRLLASDLEGVRDCYRLQIEILTPMPKIDWGATRLGRRVAARDARLDRDDRL